MEAGLRTKHFDAGKILPSLRSMKCRYRKEGDFSDTLKLVLHVAQKPGFSQWPKLLFFAARFRLPTHYLPVHGERRNAINFNNIWLTFLT